MVHAAAGGIRLSDVLPAERRAANAPGPWLVRVARLGYAGCGLVYLAIGLVAGAVAVGLAERARGSRGIFRLIATQPFGRLIVAALVVGMVSYAALNFAGAIRDPGNGGRTLRGIATRIADALTGAVYVMLAVAALRIVADPEGDGSQTARDWAAQMLQLPFGEAAVGIAAIGVSAGGVYLLRRAWAEPFGEKFDRRALRRRGVRMMALVARVGTAARGAILVVCGLLLLRVATGAAPERVGTLGHTLDAIDSTAAGPWLLGVLALGFIAYGIYQLAKVRYRRFGTPASPCP